MSYLEELLPEFRKGAKIRRKEWDEDVFIYFYKDEIYWKDSGAWKNGEIASTKELVSLFTLHHDDWELYQEPIGWDYIIKNKCLCWFYDEQVVYDELGYLLDRCDTDKPFAMIDMFGKKRYFSNCRPTRRDEVTFYEDREDE